MRNFFIKLLVIFLLAAGGYGLYRSHMPLPDGMLAVVYDKKTGSPVFIASPGTRFIPYAAFHWMYTVETIALARNLRFDVRTDVPSLAGLKEDFYGISIPVTIDYSLQWDRIDDPTLFRDDASPVKTMIMDKTILS